MSGAQQGRDGGASGNGYLKIIVAVKHATAYQVENNRFARNENISAHDLSDTFYPAWEAVMEQGSAAGFMCAYPAVNGVPCCGDAYFMNELMKDTWGMGSSHGGGSYVQGDCGAIENIASAHHYAANTTFAAAVALNAGADVDCGNGLPGQLGQAIAMGLTTEMELDASLTRTYTMQMLAGRFDPPSLQPYMSIPFEAIDSAEHQALAYESGLQGMVLLRNDAALLPLPAAAGGKPRTLAFVGPLASNSDLAGNYYEMRAYLPPCQAGGFSQCLRANQRQFSPRLLRGRPTRALFARPPIRPPARPCARTPARLRALPLAPTGCADNTLSCIPTLLAVASARVEGNITYAQGCVTDGPVNATLIAAAASLAAQADVAFLALGTDSEVAQEGNDRADTTLPGAQHALAVAVLAACAAANVPVVVLLFNGGTMELDDIAALPQRLAIVEAFFPGESGGSPIIDQLFDGAAAGGALSPNRWGKLPVTYYGVNFTNAIPIDDMRMVATPGVFAGRGYRYYDGS